MEILEKALAWAQENYPDAPKQHQAAFANSVNYLVSGWSGGYGGPSIREHSVSHSLYSRQNKEQKKAPGEWSFEDACEFCRNLCFGPVTQIHLNCYRSEHCFDDTQEDLLALHSFRGV